MSVQATTWVWDHSRAEDNTRLVALAIADAANKQGGESCQSVKTIMQMTRSSETTVHRAIKWLLEAGEIECVGTNKRYGNTRIYRFPALWSASVPYPSEGGANMTGGAIGGTGGVPSAGERGAVGGTQPQRTPQEDNPSASAPADGGEKAPSIDDQFAEWWQIYPKKVDKKKARESFVKAVQRVGFETVQRGLVRYVKALRADGKVTVTSVQVGKDQPPQYEVRMVAGAAVLNPTTWLNGDRWEDDHESSSQAEPSAAVDDRDSWMHRTGDE